VRDNNAVHHLIEEDSPNNCVRTLPQKRKHTHYEAHNSSASSSTNTYFEEASAKIDAATTKFLLELKEKRAQAALEHSSAMAQIVQDSNNVELQRQREEVRHQQQLATIAREQHQLIEKADNYLLHQSKTEAYIRSLKARQKRLDWTHAKERDDYSEQQRRDTQDYEDERRLKLARAERQMEQEDARQEFERQQKIQRQANDRELNRTVVLDTLRKGKVSEENTSHMLESIFNKQDGKAPQGGEKSEIEGTPYKPYNPFGDSA
jgi:hypothetical protein